MALERRGSALTLYALRSGISMTYIPQHSRVSDEHTVQEFMRTYDFATLGAVQSHNAIATIPACEFVQIRVALTCVGTNASPQLRTVTLR